MKTVPDELSTVDVGAPLLQEVVQRILRVGKPKSIILFGSHARGDFHDRSDLDLLIVERENPQPRHRRAAPYRMALLGIDRDIDVVVYTPAEIHEWSGVPNAFITTVVREGKVIYEDSGVLAIQIFNSRRER